MMTVDLCYRNLKNALNAVAQDAAAYEAKEIIGAVLKLPEAQLRMIPFSGKKVTAEAQAEMENILERRNQHEPLEYILGYAWFYGLRFSVSSDCLIPQADTEIVCEKLISYLKDGMHFADICTGSGCIALAALSQTKNTTAIGYDISDGALQMAKKNAEDFGLSDRFQIQKADVFAQDFLKDVENLDCIVSNPPYIESAVIPTLSAEVQNEPHIALDGGADGLDFYRRLLDVCPAHIKKGGALFLEIGYDQKNMLEKLCQSYGFTYEFYRDFGGNDRVCAVFP